MRRRPLTIASLLGLALASSAGVGSYTVRPGDSLSLVAKRLGTSVAALTKANNITNPDRVKVGQVLKLSSVPAPSPAPAPVAASKPAAPATYVIKPGDSLSVIAKRLGVTADALAKANKITNLDRVTLGQVLAVPGAAPVATPPLAPKVIVPVPALNLKPIAAVKAVVVEPGLPP